MLKTMPVSFSLIEKSVLPKENCSTQLTLNEPSIGTKRSRLSLQVWDEWECTLKSNFNKPVVTNVFFKRIPRKKDFTVD